MRLKRLHVAIALLVIFAASSGCDEWEPALGVGLSESGGPVVYPVLCGDESTLSAELIDLGVTDYEDIDDEGGVVLWRSETTSTGDPAPALVSASPPAQFVEPVGYQGGLESTPANRWVRVNLEVRRGSRELHYEEEYQVGDLQQGVVYASWYGWLSAEEWDEVKRDNICDSGYPGLIPQLSDKSGLPGWFWGSVLLAAFTGLMFGIAWVGKRLGQPRPRRGS